MERSGLFTIPEGQIFWKLNLPEGDFPKDKPLLLFIHAGVADHTLWDAQVQYLTPRGWPTLRYDLFGFGQSKPDDAYLAADPRSKVDYLSHVTSLVTEVWHKEAEKRGSTLVKVVAIGLSMGGGLAIDFAINHPELCCGLVAAAASLSGFDGPSKPEEDTMMTEVEKLTKEGDADGVAKLNVRYWGDGPLQPEERLAGPVREKLLEWCSDIASRECQKTGGSVFPSKKLESPSAQRLSELRIPVGVAIGLFDESWTVAAMEYLGKNSKRSSVVTYNAAHMVNLEFTTEFNDWLEKWLDNDVVVSA
ncbi:hypothetical protein MMC10_008472 [Thelotrema lepadinum]|nr:hypothetical protein [Thelotrema lepadinum]